MRIIFILLAALIVGCHNVESTNKSGSDSASSAAGANRPSTDTVKTDFTKDSLITLRFPKDSNSIAILAKMNGISKPVTVNIPVTKGSELKVTLTTKDSIANIRVNQIFTPSGKADGPFGKTVERKISEKGIYKLIIGEDLMQGDEWKGTFSLKVSIR